MVSNIHMCFSCWIFLSFPPTIYLRNKAAKKGRATGKSALTSVTSESAWFLSELSKHVISTVIVFLPLSLSANLSSSACNIQTLITVILTAITSHIFPECKCVVHRSLLEFLISIYSLRCSCINICVSDS